MRKKIFSILAGVMMIALTVAGVVYAREVFDLEVEGRVGEVGLDYLMVDGVRYEIVEDSEVDEEIVVDDWIKIKYYEDEGMLIIVEAEIEDEPEMEYEEVEVEGTVLTFTEDLLTLEEYIYEFLITDDSEIEDEIEVGDYVKVKYYEDDEGQLFLIEVELEDEDDDEMEYEEFEVEGTVDTFTEDLLTLEEYEYEFLIMEDSEIEDEIVAGDYVKVKYYEDDEGQLILIEVELEDEDDDDMEPSDYCSSDLQHPALLKLAESHTVDYEILEPYFCEQGFGVGEIKHALETAELEEVDGTFEELLDMRKTDGMKDVGWGEIWQELGLIGNGKQDNEESESEAMKNKHQEEFQFEGEEEQFEYEAKNKEKNENKPNTPPGQSDDHPGKGKGRGN